MANIVKPPQIGTVVTLRDGTQSGIVKEVTNEPVAFYYHPRNSNEPLASFYGVKLEYSDSSSGWVSCADIL